MTPTGPHVNMVNTKTKNKNLEKIENAFFIQKFKQRLRVWPRGSYN